MMSMPSGTGAESTSVRPGPASQSGVGHPGAGQSSAADRLAQINNLFYRKDGDRAEFVFYRTDCDRSEFVSCRTGEDMLKQGSCWVEGDRAEYVFFMTGGDRSNSPPIKQVETGQNCFL